MSTSTLQSAAAADVIRSGDLLHVRNATMLGCMIRRAIGSWANHDALLVRPESELCAGDATWPRAVCTPLADYDRRIAKGKTQAVVLRPVSVTAAQSSIAAAWWLSNILGKPYDLGAFPRLILKSIVGDLCQWPAGWEWAWYCTEGCRDAYLRGAGLDLYGKNNPTPRTTEKRIAVGIFQIVWTSIPDFKFTIARYTQ